MKKDLFRCALIAVAMVAWAPAACADSWTFSLTPPGGAISGAPGSTIGWGYSVTNQSGANWLMLTSLSADPFVNATPDASYFSFPIIAPGVTVTVAFDATTFTGLFGLTWDATAPVGFTNSGTFILSGEFWDADPLADGNFVSLGLDQSAAYSAAVSQPPGVPIPEPSTLLFMASGITSLLWRRRYCEEKTEGVEHLNRNQALGLSRHSVDGSH